METEDSMLTAAPRNKVSIWDVFETSKEAEAEGVWIDYGGSFKLLIAAASDANPLFMKTSERLFKPHRQMMDASPDAMDREVLNSVTRSIYAESILLDWDGVTDKTTGEEIKHSTEAALKLFVEMPRLFREVVKQASSMALYREKALERDAGNS